MARKRARRFNNKKVTYEGHEFDSQTEMEFYKYLKKNKEVLNINRVELHKTFKIIKDYEVECKRCRGVGRTLNEKTGNMNQCTLCKGEGERTQRGTTYTPDFIIHYNDGYVEYIDVKGGPTTPVFNLKKKLFAKLKGKEVIIVRKKGGEFIYERW